MAYWLRNLEITPLYRKLFQNHPTRYIAMDQAKIKILDEIFRPDLPDLTGWRKMRRAWGIFNISPTCVTRERCKRDPRPQLRLCCRPLWISKPNAVSAIYYLPNDLSFAHHPRVELCVPLGSKYRNGLSSRNIPSTMNGVSPQRWRFSRCRAQSNAKQI